MRRGWGVDVAIHHLGLELRALGHRITIGCLDDEGVFRDHPIHVVTPTAAAVRELAARCGAQVIVAHTSPFFELIPELADAYPCWAWEYGDPTPALFPDDGTERQRIKRHKQEHAYGRARGVVAISEFIRTDIGFPAARVVYIGCDHAPDLGPKGLGDEPLGSRRDRPLRLGTLMRLGAGEARYKGNHLFIELCERLRAAGVPVQACVMGRGTPADARAFAQSGIEVHLDAPEGQKWAYLRGLDLFISCSLWEGFNLPLVEAMALGTPGLAFDTGAHPEVTPFVLGSLAEAVELVRACAQDREHLGALGRRGYHFVRSRFSWREAALAFQGLALAQGIPGQATDGDGPRRLAGAGRAAVEKLHALRRAGVRGAIRRLLGRR